VAEAEWLSRQGHPDTPDTAAPDGGAHGEEGGRDGAVEEAIVEGPPHEPRTGEAARHVSDYLHG